MNETIHYQLDITEDICPMTFVKARLLIEKMSSGEIAEIRLTGGEPLENVPASLTELGHEILSVEREPDDTADMPDASSSGIHRIRVRKC